MFLEVRSLSKSHGGKPVFSDVSFSLQKGEIVSLIGPSGVGKTTLLKIIAGLEAQDSGEVAFSRTPDRDNPVILVFQDYLLFPNLTVFDNVAFGLKARKVSTSEREHRVMELLDYFGLADKRGQYPNQLSAGQRQRVAIARAMVVNPALLLLDEPFANLDRNLKAQTAEFIRETQKNFGVTTVVVTHDQEEAFLMSDQVGVMLSGKLVQFAPAREVYESPVNIEAARFLGPVNVIPQDVARVCSLAEGDDPFYARPEQLRIEPSLDGNAVVKNVVFAGHYRKYTVEVEGCSLVVFGSGNGIRIGERVSLRRVEDK